MAAPRCCEYCGIVIEHSKPAVRCVDCSETEADAFQLCLECFSCGVELGPHKNAHSYSIMYDSAHGESVRLFDNTGWTAGEDDALLDGIESHGFGNWEAVRYHVPNRTAEECERRYVTYFVDGSIGQATLQLSPALQNIDDTVLSYHSRLLPIPQLAVQQQIELGYMALRDDFIIEFDNEYESTVSDLSINYFDTPLDTVYKLFRIDTYRQQLRQRVAKKEIAKRFHIYNRATSLGMKALSSAKKKTTKEEKTFEIAMKVFGKFTYRSDIKRLFYSTQRQLKLMKQISMLRKFNEKGFTSLTGKLKMHAVQMNGMLKDGSKRRKRKRYYYK